MFVHVPGLAVRVWPSWARPVIVGGLTLTGGCGAGTTTALGGEIAGPNGATPDAGVIGATGATGVASQMRLRTDFR